MLALIMSTLLEKIASDEAINAAYQWLCKKRLHYHPNADVWQVRRWWHEKKPVLQAQILSGNFQFRELRLIRGEEKSIEWWSSLDALVLKAMTSRGDKIDEKYTQQGIDATTNIKKLS